MSRTWVTWLGLAVVALAAAVLSFAALRDLAAVCGTAPSLAWLLPLCIDAAALVATRLWLTEAAPDRARRFARTLALAMIALSVAGNGTSHFLAAYHLLPAWWAIVGVSAVPPLVLGAVAHLAALAASQQPEHANDDTRDTSNVGAPGGDLAAEWPGQASTPEPAPVPAPVPVADEPVPDQPVAGGLVGHQAHHQAPGGDLVGRAAHLVAAGAAAGRKVGRGTLARELGISENQARQVLRQVAEQRTPTLHAVGGAR